MSEPRLQDCIKSFLLRLLAEHKHSIEMEYRAVPKGERNRATEIVLPLVSKDPDCTFINANMVTAGQEGDPRYIATQAPSGWGWSEANFWRMVLQQRAEVVVDLQAVHGMYATQYWPDHDAADSTRTWRWGEGSIQVRHEGVVAELSDGDVTVTTLTVTSSCDEHLPLRVHHIYYPHWPDFELPGSVAGLVKVMAHMNRLRGLLQQPVVVHCMAGVGRTGTFITIDTLLHRLRRARDAERLDSAEEPCDSVGVDPLSSRALGPLDVAGTLACLRLSRSRLITDLAMYYMVNDVVASVILGDLPDPSAAVTTQDA